MNKIELKTIFDQLGTIQKTAKYFECSYCKIKYWLEKHAIPFQLEKNLDLINQDELKEVYTNTQSIRKVGKHFNMSHEKARTLLKKHGLINKPIRYKVNHDFFYKNDQFSFYWAGFLAADGCILDKKGSTKIISLGLSKKDEDHIEKFKNNLQAENPIGRYLIKNSKRNPAWKDCWKSEIKIMSNELCKSLERFNIMPRKTKTYKFPEWLMNNPLVHHFMRGYFDGDGSLFFSLGKTKKTKQLYFNLRGTSNFLTVYRSVLEEKCNLTEKDKPIRINNGIGVLEYGGNGIVGKIVKFLYNDADIYLDRKYNLAKELINDQI